MDRYSWKVYTVWNGERLVFDGFRARSAARIMARNLRKNLNVPTWVRGRDIIRPNIDLRG